MKKILFGVAALGLLGLAGACLGLKAQDTVEAKAAVGTPFSGIYLAGSMNNWLQNNSKERSPQIVADLFGDAYQFSYAGQNNEGKYLYTLTAELEAGTFKIWDYEHGDLWVNYWNTTNISGDLLSDGNNEDERNITLSKRGIYTIVYAYASGIDKQVLSFDETDAGDEIHKWCMDFINDTNGICETGTVNDDHSDALQNIWNDTATVDSSYYVRGTFNDWTDVADYRLKQVSDSNIYRLSNVLMVKDARFKVFADDWYPGSDITITTPGWYYIEFDDSTNAVSYGLRKYLADSYNELSAGAKALFKLDSEDDKVVDAYKRYKHIVNRYSLTNFAGVSVSPAYVADAAVHKADSTVAVPLIITIAASAMGIGAMIFARKRRAE